MHAYRNKTNSKYGQVIESQIDLLANVGVDLKENYYIFRNQETGQEKLRIKQLGTQLWYNVIIEGDWSQDIPLTIDDPDQLKNLPIYPALFNSNTYARMDTDFRLYFEGDQYLRISHNEPTILVGEVLHIQLDQSEEPPIASFSSAGLGMHSNRITDLANPQNDTDATNRQFVQVFDVPIGVISAYFANSVPAGYLYCNGQSFDANVYPELYALLGTNVLPDLRGYFLRSTSDSDVVDPSGPRTVGSVQTDEFKSHQHFGVVQYVDSYYSENMGTNLGFYGQSSSGDNDNQPLTMTRSADFTTNSTGGLETRPKNITVRYIIKALPSQRLI